ncbi:helix-turn-helix domain-containing protein [Mangrovicoccus ximenensis]|uniref:helix-turn-helix domain-containing protein n=1 Tax=Mangrovicoccus ximenensis TaxID=1911570 RepID=UPI001375115C|nr:helix-turn-helix domain-containing protein [Mangrovicoccus ximenensis]
MSPAPRPGDFVLDRWEVLQLVKDTSRALGIGEREIAVLAAHLSLLPKGPVRASGLCMSYAEIGGILGRANCMDERRFRRGETRLSEAGLVARKLSGNGRRYPVRDGRGQIVDAYGIDLRPLFLRVPELEELRARLAEDAARRNAQRSRLSARLSHLRRSMGDRLPDSLAALLDELGRLCRRASADTAALTAAERRLLAAETELSCAPETPAPAALPDIPAADAGQSVRCTESPEKENKQSPDPKVRIPDLLNDCPKVSAYFPDPPGDPQTLARCLFDFLGFLGLRTGRRTEVLNRLSLAELLPALEYILDRLDKLRDPGAYLLSMISRIEAGEPVAAGRLRRRVPAL